MIHRHQYKDIIWIDLESPTVEEVRSITHEFDLDARTADELLVPSMKPRVDAHDAYLYLVLHFPAVHRTHKSVEQEVDFIVGEKFIITTRYESIDTFHNFEKVFDVDATLEHSDFAEDATDVFLTLVRRLYRSVEHEIDRVRDDLEDIEREIFEGHEREMVVAISRVGRDVLNIKQSLDPHSDVWHSLSDAMDERVREKHAHKVRGTTDVYYRALKHTTRLWQTLAELRETNNSLLTTKQNEVMKIFTILAFVTFPLSLVASIFGMNTEHTPLLGAPHDFWLIVIWMLAVTALMYWYFKHRRWL